MTKERPPNDLQIVAAGHRGAAYLVEAGPGTGKTQTLTSRVDGLLAEGVGSVTVETGVPDEAIEKLRSMGHNIARTQRSSTYGGYQGILIDWQHGVLHGATESRKDGVAAGY